MKEFRQDPSPPKHCAVRLPVEIMKGRQRGGWERDGWLEWSNVKEYEGRDKTQIKSPDWKYKEMKGTCKEKLDTTVHSECKVDYWSLLHMCINDLLEA